MATIKRKLVGHRVNKDTNANQLRHYFNEAQERRQQQIRNDINRYTVDADWQRAEQAARREYDRRIMDIMNRYTVDAEMQRAEQLAMRPYTRYMEALNKQREAYNLLQYDASKQYQEKEGPFKWSVSAQNAYNQEKENRRKQGLYDSGTDPLRVSDEGLEGWIKSWEDKYNTYKSGADRNAPGQNEYNPDELLGGAWDYLDKLKRYRAKNETNYDNSVRLAELETSAGERRDRSVNAARAMFGDSYNRNDYINLSQDRLREKIYNELMGENYQDRASGLSREEKTRLDQLIDRTIYNMMSGKEKEAQAANGLSEEDQRAAWEQGIENVRNQAWNLFTGRQWSAMDFVPDSPEYNRDALFEKVMGGDYYEMTRNLSDRERQELDSHIYNAINILSGDPRYHGHAVTEFNSVYSILNPEPEGDTTAPENWNDRQRTTEDAMETVRGTDWTGLADEDPVTQRQQVTEMLFGDDYQTWTEQSSIRENAALDRRLDSLILSLTNGNATERQIKEQIGLVYDALNLYETYDLNRKTLDPEAQRQEQIRQRQAQTTRGPIGDEWGNVFDYIERMDEDSLENEINRGPEDLTEKEQAERDRQREEAVTRAGWLWNTDESNEDIKKMAGMDPEARRAAIYYYLTGEYDYDEWKDELLPDEAEELDARMDAVAENLLKRNDWKGKEEEYLTLLEQANASLQMAEAGKKVRQDREKLGQLSMQASMSGETGDYDPTLIQEPKTYFDPEDDVNTYEPQGTETDKAYFWLNNPHIMGGAENSVMYANKYMFATPEQVDIFNRLFKADKKNGTNYAQSYLEGLDAYLQSNLSEFQHYSAKTLADQPVTGVIARIGGYMTQPVTGLLSTIGAGLALAGNKEGQNENSLLYLPQKFNTDIRERQNENIDKWATETFGDWARGKGKFMMGVVDSIVDNMVSMATASGLTSGIADAGKRTKRAISIVQAIMSGEATGNTMIRQLENGRDPTEAALYAIGDGVIEWITERVSIETLLSGDMKEMLKNPKKLLTYLRNVSVAEGSEEINADILNMGLDTILSMIYDHQTEISERYNDMVNEGVDPKEASKQVLLDKLGEMGLSGLAGALSGFALGISRVAANKMSETRYGKNIQNKEIGTQKILELGLKMSENSDSRALAEEIQKKREKGEKPSRQSLGRLAQLISMETSEERRNVIRDTLVRDVRAELEKRGVDQTQAKTYAEVIGRNLFEASRMSVQDRKTLAQDSRAIQLWKEFNSGAMTPTKIRTSLNVYEETKPQRDVLQEVGELVSEPVRALSAMADEVKRSVRETKSTEEAIDNLTARVPNLMSDSYAELSKQLLRQDPKAKKNKGYLDDVVKVRLTAMTMGRSMPRTNLNPETAQKLWDEAKREFNEKDKERIKNLGYKAEPGKGSATYDGAEYGTAAWTEKIRNLNKNLRNQIGALGEVATRIGAKVNVINDTEHPAINGFESGDGTITINLAAAGKKGFGQHMLVTISHELTHWLGQTSMEAYGQLRQFIFDKLRETGENVEQLAIRTINDQNTALSEMGISEDSLTLNGAVDEIVAKGCENVLSNAKVAQELQNTNPSLYSKIRQFVKDFTARIRQAIPGMAESLSYEARTLLQYTDEITDHWLGAWREGIAQQQQSEEGKTDVGVSWSLSQLNRMSDSELNDAYKKAAAENNTADMQAAVREEANRNGYTDDVYHGTTSFGFTDFDMVKSRNAVFVAYNEALARTYTKDGQIRAISDRTVGDVTRMSDSELLDAARKVITDVGGDPVQRITLLPNGQFQAEYYDSWDNKQKKIAWNRRETQQTIQQKMKNKGLSEGVYHLYARPGNQLVIDANKASAGAIRVEEAGRTMTTREIAEWAKQQGYDSVRINNIRNQGGRNINASLRDSDDVKIKDIGIFFNQADLKSADPAVYDDQGKMIPLSERFNQGKTDIRYSVKQLDAEYAKAVREKNWNRAEQMLMDKYQQMERKGLIGYRAAYIYNGDHAEIARQIKNGDPEVVRAAAEEMAPKVPENAVLIPMPPHDGRVTDSTDTMILAKAISEITGRPVINALESDRHMSRNYAKQNNIRGVSAESMGFRQIADVPADAMPVFIDNVVGGAVTAQAAHNALGRGITLAYAQSSRAKIQGAKYLSVTRDSNGELIPLSQRMDPEKGWKYSLSNTGMFTHMEYMKSFAEQIDDFMDPNIDNQEVFGKDDLLVGRAPAVFKKIGLPDLPVTINQKHVSDSLYGNYETEKYREGHTFSKEEFKKLPEKIANPIAIAYDPSTTSAVIVYVDMINQTGDQVVVPVKIGGISNIGNNRINALKLNTVYAKTDGINMLNSAIIKNSDLNPTLYYIDKKRAAASRLGDDTKTIVRGLASELVHTISDANSKVKTNIKDQTDTIQFKNWFRGSKVVNEDGSPMIVYHGTSEDFTVFDRTKGRSTMDIQGMFFSPWEIEASGYGEKVGAYYLSIKNPAPEGLAYKALNMFKGQNNAGVKAREYLIKQGYDGVQNYDEFIAFYPAQIKSATNNIGTFDPNNPDIRYSIQQSPDVDVNNFMMGLKEWNLGTVQEKIMLRQYQQMRSTIDVLQMKIDDRQREMRKLKAKEKLSAYDRNQISKINNWLQNDTYRLERMQKQLVKVTGSEGYARLMYQQNSLMKNLVSGRTAGELSSTVDAILNELENVNREMAERAEKLNKLKGSEAVLRIRQQFNSAGLKRIAAQLKADMASDLENREIENRLALIALKMKEGKFDSETTEELADLLMNRMRGGYDSYILSELRGSTITLSKGQLAELKATHSSLREIQKELAGTGIRISSKGNTTLDQKWNELCDLIPSLDRNAGEKDMLDNLMSVIRSEKNTAFAQRFENENVQQTTEMVLKAAQALVPEILQDEKSLKLIRETLSYVQEISGQAAEAAQAMTDIGKMIDRMKRAGAQARGQAATLTGDVGEAIEYFDELAKQSEAETWRKDRLALIDQLKSENTKQLMQEQEKWKQKIEKDKTAREMAQGNMQLRKKITTNFSRIRKLLVNETDQRNIPEHMKGLAREMLGMIVNNDLAGRKISGIDLKDLQETKRILDVMKGQDGEFTMQDLQLIHDEEAQAMVLDALAELESGIGFYNARPSGNLITNLQGYRNALERISQAVATITSVINAERSVNFLDRQIAVADAAEDVARDMRKTRYKGDLIGRGSKGINTTRRAVFYGNLTPVYYFKMLKNAGMDAQWQEMQRGENRSGLEMEKARERIAALAEKTGYKNWAGEQHEVVLGGQKRTISIENMMELYAIWKREHTLNPEMSQHLSKGGVYIQDTKQDEGRLRRDTQQQRAVRVTDAEIQQMYGQMTDAQKEWLDGIVSYLSNEMSALGNQASMRMYGIEKYKEKYYFPMKVWDGVKSARSDKGITGVTENRAASRSWSKRRMHMASNALVIGNFTEDAISHIVEMIHYNTMGPAIENINKVLNYQFTEGLNPDEMTKRNMRVMFQEAYGKEALRYLEEFMKDLNGGLVQDQRKTLRERALSTFKKNAVAGSISVAAQQPLSYIRAAMLISPKYLAQAILPMYWKGSFAEMMANSGVAVIKEMGRFDMNFGQSAKDFIRPKTRQSLYTRASDKMTALPQLMDRMTWTRMWSAVKAEVAAQNKGADVNSDAFMQKVTERFNQVMRETQVYDSVMVKSSNMRSQNLGMKVITSFMAEPTVSLNVLANALQDALTKEKGSAGKVARAGATFLLSAVMQAAVKGFMSSGRTPDEKKTRLENFLNRMLQNLISEVNPLGLIPGYSDLIEVLKNGELKDDAMGVLGKLLTMEQTLINAMNGNGRGWYRDLEDTAGQLAQLFTNVPAKNIMRDARAMRNWIIGDTYAQRKTSAAVLKYQAEASVFTADTLLGTLNVWLGEAGFKATNTAYYNRIYQAMRKGDTKTADELKEYLKLGKGVSEEKISQTMRSMTKKDDSVSMSDRIGELRESGMEDSDIAGWITQQYKDGKITKREAVDLYLQANPDKTKEEAYWKFEQIEWEAETGKDVGESQYFRLNDALNGTDMSAFNAAVEELKKHGVKEDKIQDHISSYLMKKFKDGEADRAATEKALKMYRKDMSADEIWWKLDRADYQKETGADSVSGYYYRLKDAMDANKSAEISREVSTLLKHGITKEKIKNMISQTYKGQYLAAGSDGKIRIRDAITKAYKAAGYKAEDAKKIIDGWTKEKKKKK